MSPGDASRLKQHATMHFQQQLFPKLPPMTLKPFNPGDFPVWADSAERFFNQYHLWDIVTGERKNPAGDDIEPSTALNGKMDLGLGSGPRPGGRFLIGEPNPDSPHEVSVYNWNNDHSTAYNYLMNSLENHHGTYGRCATTKRVDKVWEMLQAEYNLQSDTQLNLLEHKLSLLRKGADTTMRQHVDAYSELVERIQHHLPIGQHWSNETIIQKFFGTLDQKQWISWIRSYGGPIKTMRPIELYAEIRIDDEILHPHEPEKEANLAARISNGRGNGGRGKGKHNRNKGKGKNNRFQPYDLSGLHYDGNRPSADYVQRMKDKFGQKYHECEFCAWPGHGAGKCNHLKEAKARQRESTSQNSNPNRENTSSSSNAKFICWQASVTELVANAATAMRSENIWGLDSHANVYITPYRHRVVAYCQLEQPEQVAGWQGAVDTVVGIGSVELVSQQGRYRLDDVYYAPKASKQLLSEGKLLTDDGLIACTGETHVEREHSRSNRKAASSLCMERS